MNFRDIKSEANKTNASEMKKRKEAARIFVQQNVPIAHSALEEEAQ